MSQIIANSSDGVVPTSTDDLIIDGNTSKDQNSKQTYTVTEVFTDPRDGQSYTTIIIGDQVWMSENLNYETPDSWWYDNNTTNGDIYGRLYTWDAAITACPSGWHLPSDDEWKELEMYLGMSQVEADALGFRGLDQLVGAQMKSTTGWPNNGNGTNSSGFNGLPGGLYYQGFGFNNAGYFWTSTPTGSYAWYRYLADVYDGVNRHNIPKFYAYSVRCLMDDENIGDVIIKESFDSEIFPPTGWVQTTTNASNTWLQGNPTENTFSDIDPTNVYSALCPWVAEDQDEWLISPAFSLSDGISSLEFYAGFSTDYLANATLKLNISTDGGTNWTEIWEANEDSQGWLWRLITLDLSSYANNSNVMLGWQYVGIDGDIVGIDNVSLVSVTSGIDDIPLSELTFTSSNYPNPFAMQTTISLQLENQSDIELIVYNSLGQKIEQLFQGNLNAGDHQFIFNAKNIKSGVYYYRFIVDGISSGKPILLSK